MCLYILRWLHLPPDCVRQTALITHLRRCWMHDSRGTGQRSVFCFMPFTLVPGKTLWFTTITPPRPKKMFYQHWTALLKLTQVGQDIPLITSPLYLHLWIGYHGDFLSQSFSSDHYFLSGLGDATRCLAHSFEQPNWPDQTLGRGYQLDDCLSSVFSVVLAVLLITEIFKSKLNLLSLLILTFFPFLLLLAGDMIITTIH